MAEQTTQTTTEERKKRTNYHYEIPLVEGVTAEYNNGVLKITGPQGSIEKKILARTMTVKIENNNVILETQRATKRDKRMINTYRAHIRNMIRGAKEGHTYKVIVASTHFPMTVSIQGNVLTVKNFVGEKKPRTIIIPENVKAKVSGNIIEIQSASKEAAGNFAGSLEKLTKRPNFDTRIFQDGLYIIEKDGKKI